MGSFSTRRCPTPAADGERNHQRRRHQEVRLDALVDARLEVAIAGEDAGGDQIMLVHQLLDVRLERARVADAGGAAVTHRGEAELVQVGCRPVFSR